MRAARRSLRFISRGDDSGTHRRELSLWTGAGIDLAKVRGRWYRATGTGMGATLNIAAASDAYALTDRGTWLKFKNKRRLKILFEGDKRLYNQYAILTVNEARHPYVNGRAARRLSEWMISAPTQKLIGGYKVSGQFLFVPNAKQVTRSTAKHEP